MPPIPSSEITPEALFWNRRRFIQTALAGAALTLPGCAATSPVTTATPAPDAPAAPTAPAGAGKVTGTSDELGQPLTEFAAVTGYNNYYEFTTDKQAVAATAANFVASPWSVQVDGLVAKPRQFALEDILKLGNEERIYRLRCVEGWSMVIPWSGFSLNKLLALVEPTSAAKYVRFETLNDSSRMPGQKEPWYTWPYAEGLRLDEAMHDLTLIATGVYGNPLPAQNGAPLRLAVPWKYGFKSIKAIVRITLTDTQPTSLWMAAAPDEYGFYANVNPRVDHPRWSQADERRIGESGRRETLMFNGYDKQVASLYTGMDLRKFY